MIDTETRKAINAIGQDIEGILPYTSDFFGKITFNFTNGKYINSNVETSIKPIK